MSRSQPDARRLNRHAVILKEERDAIVRRLSALNPNDPATCAEAERLLAQRDAITAELLAIGRAAHRRAERRPALVRVDRVRRHTPADRAAFDADA